MGNLCSKDIPNINLSCINNGMVSSCCKNGVDKFETATFYKWIYYIHDVELKNKSYAWYETFDQCKEMHCVMFTCIIHTYKMQYILTSTDGLWELHQCCLTKDN